MPDTMEFIGVNTAGSSSRRLFPVWADVLGIPGSWLVGHDLPLDADPACYRAAIDQIATDPEIRGALITTHKVKIHAAAADLFDDLDPLARLCGEVSCVSKRAGRLLGHAKDPVTAGRALHHLLAPEHFARTGGHVLCLGAGGAGTAIAAHFLTRAADPPERLVLTDTAADRLDAVRAVAERAGAQPLALHSAADTEQLLAALPPDSLIINATGLGKDRPGSPLPAGATFPDRAIAWELNYRGELPFLQQARAARLRTFDGWLYFLHGWSEHIAQVFDLAVPPELFERLRHRSGEDRP
ncbi:MAG TPA: hypothetical protein VHC49_19080 [Mycobacteriales bacterium]|nr:hypothetical protein [Mycobacteriales bacterium]